MTKEEILEVCVWSDLGLATIEVYGAIFEYDVSVKFIPDFGKEITDVMVSSLNDFLNLTKEDLAVVKNLLWSDCQESFIDSTYGSNSPISGETNLDSNKRHFNIYDEEGAYSASYFQDITIEEIPEIESRYVAINFEPVWEQEHGISIIVKNGGIIAKSWNDIDFNDYE